MGSLRETSTGKTLTLEPEHVIGRGLTCALRLEPSYVSAQHALIRYAGPHWEVRDLASRNGTFVDGRRIPPGEEHALARGARVAFGDLAAEWELVDDSSPQVMAIPLDGRPPIVIEGDLLALPSAEDPQCTIYRSAANAWLLERPNEAATGLANLQVFQCSGRFWRFCCAENISATTRFPSSLLELHVGALELVFDVSRDEEHVVVTVHGGGRTLEMGERAHNFLLLTLARQRLADADDGLPETSAGWVDLEDLAHDSRMAPPQLNIDVFRLRRQFADKGVVDAAAIVERRPGQLRVGAGKIVVKRR